MSVTVKVGDRIRDCDPRRTYTRILTIAVVYPNGVGAEDADGRWFTILLRRIHDKPDKRSGFFLVTGGTP